MIWGAYFDFEDYGLEGIRIVATLSCSECNATAEFYSVLEEEKETVDEIHDS